MDTFWQSKDAAKYDSFALRVPSDAPAYAVTYSLLKPEGKAVLDYGCFRGASTRRISEEGASFVLGVDNVEDNVEHAKLKYGDGKLDFLYVPTEAQIDTDLRFDAISMTFVHPSTPTLDDLVSSFRKIAGVSKRNSRIAILGLHPNSFNGYTFTCYGHRLTGPQVDGAIFENNMRLGDGTYLRFQDYFWSDSTLIKMLEGAGFGVDQVLDIDHALPHPQKKAFDQAIHSREKIPVWVDEWTAPLYQVISGRKR